MNLKTNWTINNDVLFVENEYLPHFTYSTHIKNNLSMKYWDGLFWYLHMIKANSVLLLGIGGGSVLQLIERWGDETLCTAVDIDGDMIKRIKSKNWFDFNRFQIVIDDAKNFIKQDTNKYDLIIVDLYNNSGYVEECYNLDFINRIKNRIHDNGKIMFQCFDPSIKYLTMHLDFPYKISSITNTISNELFKVFNEVHIYPLWANSLVVAGRKLNMDLSIDEEDLKLKWLHQFYVKRCQSKEKINTIYCNFNKSFTFKNIIESDKKYLSDLVASCPEDKQSALEDFFDVVNNDSKGTFLEIRNDKSITITDEFLEIIMKFNWLVELNKIGNNEKNLKILKEIVSLYNSCNNDVINDIVSYCYAWCGFWDKAYEMLVQ